MFGRLKNYIIYVAASSSILFSGFFDYSTIYGAAKVKTPYLNGSQDLKDDYEYNIGIRKIALYDYQTRNKFYKWLVSYSNYKFGCLPEEGRDRDGRWIRFRGKEELEVQGKIF